MLFQLLEDSRVWDMRGSSCHLVGLDFSSKSQNMSSLSFCCLLWDNFKTLQSDFALRSTYLAQFGHRCHVRAYLKTKTKPTQTETNKLQPFFRFFKDIPKIIVMLVPVM